MKPGAELRIATDIGDYARTDPGRHRATRLSAGPQRPRPTGAAPGRTGPATRYEAKALREGRRCYFLTFLRA